MKIVILTVSNAALADIAHVSKEITRTFPKALQLSLFYAAKQMQEGEAERIQQGIKDADFILLDLMGASREYEDAVLGACQGSAGQVLPIGGDKDEIRGLLKLGSFTGKDMKNGMQPSPRASLDSMVRMSNMAEKLGKMFPIGKLKDIKNYIQIIKYWKNAEEENIRNMLYLIGRDYGGNRNFPKPADPIGAEDTGIFDPAAAQYFSSVAEYHRTMGNDEKKPTIALLFYGHNYPNRTRGCVASFIEKCKPFANILPIAFARTTSRDIAKLRDILCVQTGKKVELVVSFLAFRLGAGPMGGDAKTAVKLLEELDVPFVHPFFMSRREVAEWEHSAQGINSTEFLIQMMLPELDGCIETIPIGALTSAFYDSDLQIKIQELTLIEERANKVVSRIQKWLALRHKPNQDKKVAMICYNYPPGEENLFGGAFLDTFVSVEKILGTLQTEGYRVGPVSEAMLRDAFTAGKLVNSGRWLEDTGAVPFIRYPSKIYRERLGTTAWTTELIKQWGQEPGDIMSEADHLLIPGKIFGNVFVGLQPSRGIHEQPEQFYHDKALLPHHQYIAFYQWLKEEFKADVIIHVGTHGTLEFLQGKECGMSGDCLPDYLLQDIPHVYLYYAGNPAEAMIAKRRSHGVLVSYQSPPFTESELYGELAELEGLVHQRQEAHHLDPSRLVPLDEMIHEKAVEQNLPYEIEELEHELYRMRRSLIPWGLHVFGHGFSEKEAAAFMKFILRYDRGDLPALQRVLAKDQGLDYDTLLENDQVSALALLDQRAMVMIEKYVENGVVPKEVLSNDKLRKSCEAVLEFGLAAYQASRDCQEHSGLIKVLSGRYLSARLAGDMVRNPEVLPTGYNLYQFDPRLVPSVVAMERGAKIAKNTLDQYWKEHGCYPNSTAVILWGLEASRTQGETVGQILYYLGVGVERKKNQFLPSFVIIPQEELDRPRINVVINICGFFRDMFPMLIGQLHDVFQQVAELNEEEKVNYLKANSSTIYQRLLEEGYSSEEAGELSTARIFGPAEGEYGSKVSKVIELKTWTDENELGQTYVNSLQHVYSKNYRGKVVKGLLDTHLSTVDIVSQVRSNHEYEVTDLDHYYEYFGGLSKSVEMAKGKKANVYITDTTGEKVQTETVDKSIGRGVRTRLLNPKWIDAMLEHSYHGAQKINDRFENILGLAATTNKVDNWIFSDMHKVYVADDLMRQKMVQNNRWAYFSMLEKLMECSKRGYWQATDEEMDKLRQAFLEVEGDIEEDI
jgi:cobaltochelatase CobN